MTGCVSDGVVDAWMTLALVATFAVMAGAMVWLVGRSEPSAPQAYGVGALAGRVVVVVALLALAVYEVQGDAVAIGGVLAAFLFVAWALVAARKRDVAFAARTEMSPGWARAHRAVRRAGPAAVALGVVTLVTVAVRLVPADRC